LINARKICTLKQCPDGSDAKASRVISLGSSHEYSYLQKSDPDIWYLLLRAGKLLKRMKRAEKFLK
jgi:hypothetical protein